MQPPTGIVQASFLGIRLEGWLTIAAIILGPIIALGLQRYSERRRLRIERQLTIFKELMATRAAQVSPRHVDALNAIEIEFSGRGKQEKAVTDAWRLYFDHLNQILPDNDQPAIARWNERRGDLLTDLLYEMSKALKYGFDKVSLKRNLYSPKAHGRLQTEETLFRQYLLELMEGKRAMWSAVFTQPERPLQMQIVVPNQNPANAPQPPARAPEVVDAPPPEGGAGV